MFSVIIFTLFRVLAEKIFTDSIKENLGLVEVLLFFATFARAVAPGLNKDQILFHALPAPERCCTEVLNALQLPLLYSFLPPCFFCSLPGISGRGNGFLAAPGFF